jgi:hypothetical protein
MQHPPKYRISNLSNTNRSTNFAKLQVASSVNHLAKLFRVNMIHKICHLLVSYFDWLSIGESTACESQGANLPKGIREENELNVK